MDDELLNVLKDGEFLVTRHSGRLQVHPDDRSKVSVWSPTLRIVVKENGPDAMYPLRVTAPDILVTVRARATD